VSVVRRSAETSIRRIRSLLAAGKRSPTHRSTRDTFLVAAALGWTWRPTGHLCHRGTVQAHLCLPGDYRVCCFPGVVRACSSPGETAMINLREATAEPCRGNLRQATGRGSPPHR